MTNRRCLVLGTLAAVALLLLAPPVSAESPYRLSLRAEEAFKAGDPAKALALYRQALSCEKRETGKAVLHFDAGACLLFLQRPSEARDEFTLALAAPQSDITPSAFYDLAHALSDGGDADGAMEALRSCLILDPGNRSAKQLYEWLLRQVPPEDEPPPKDQQPPPPKPPPPPPPSILEQLPSPPAKDTQDQVSPPPPDTPPGMKPW